MTDPVSLRLRGQLCFQRGDFDSALSCFEEALRGEPLHRETLRAAAISSLQLGRTEDARRFFGRVLDEIDRGPTSGAERAAARFDLAVAFEAGGDRSAARNAYEEALVDDPENFAARLNLCALLLTQANFDDAEVESRMLVERHPQESEAWHNRARALMANVRYEEAEVAVLRALALNPSHLGALTAQIVVDAMLGRIEDAAGHLDQLRARSAIAIPPYASANVATVLQFDRISLEHTYRIALFERYRHGDWACFSLLRQQLAAMAESLRNGAGSRVMSMEAFHAMALGVAREDYLTLVGAFSAQVASSVDRLPDCSGANDQEAGRRLRIAYLSPAFRQHPGGYLFRKLFGAHNREQFEIFGYAIGHDDVGEVRTEIVAGCDHFAYLGNQGDNEIAQRIRTDGIDILVELEGLLDDTRPRVLAMRPALLQVSYAGMLGILEAPFVDYRLAERITEGDAPTRGYRFEQPVFLPGTLLPYGCPETPWKMAVSRSSANLPDDAFVFCSFNNDFKFDPETFAAWMRILSATPGSALWLLVSSDRQWAAILALARSSGIDESRLVRASRRPNDEYLARLRLADLFLDSFHCNAHTTALDALWMELPILTRSGDTPATRFCGSALCDVGLPDLVTHDTETYVFTAIRLATEPGALADIRNRLKSGKRRSASFDPPRKAAQLEAAYRMMWDRHVAGLPPAPLEVKNP